MLLLSKSPLSSSQVTQGKSNLKVIAAIYLDVFIITFTQCFFFILCSIVTSVSFVSVMFLGVYLCWFCMCVLYVYFEDV